MEANDFPLSSLEKTVTSLSLEKKTSLQKIKERYFRTTKLERWNNGRIYEWLGIKVFKRYLILWKEKESGERTQENYFLQNFSEQGLKDFIEETYSNERIHLVSTALFLSSIVLLLATKNYSLAFLEGIGNLITNIYPIFLQRYNRVRIENILKKMQARSYSFFLENSFTLERTKTRKRINLYEILNQYNQHA